MTYLVVVTRTVADSQLPDGVSGLGSTVISLLSSNDRSVVQKQTVTDGSLMTSFSGVTVGDYVVSAQDMDTNGNALGSAVEQTLSQSQFDNGGTPPASTTFKATSGLSVSVSAE